MWYLSKIQFPSEVHRNHCRSLLMYKNVTNKINMSAHSHPASVHICLLGSFSSVLSKVKYFSLIWRLAVKLDGLQRRGQPLFWLSNALGKDFLWADAEMLVKLLICHRNTDRCRESVVWRRFSSPRLIFSIFGAFCRRSCQKLRKCTRVWSHLSLKDSMDSWLFFEGWIIVYIPEGYIVQPNDSQTVAFDYNNTMTHTHTLTGAVRMNIKAIHYNKHTNPEINIQDPTGRK